MRACPGRSAKISWCGSPGPAAAVVASATLPGADTRRPAHEAAQHMRCTAAAWSLYRDGKTIAPGEVVAPGQRLSWPRTIGIGAQHVVAMFGSTFLVPLLTGFPPATTLFFSAIGTA